MTRFAGPLLAALTAVVTLAPPVRSQQTAVEPSRIAALLADLDRAFVAGDLAAWQAKFDPDHPGAVAMFAHHLEALLRVGETRQRSSQIVAGPHRVGDRTLVRLSHETRWPGATATGLSQPLVEHSYLVLRTVDARLVPTFAIEMPVQIECVRDNQFRCGACNYQIGGQAGWLCVPVAPERGGALEAASFYLLGTDLSLDVTVRVEPEATAAAATAEQLASELAGLSAHATVGVTSRWLPPQHDEQPPTELDGARIVIELPNEIASGGASRAVLHVVTFGSLQHVLLARGSSSAFEHHAERLAEMLRSYRLLHADRALAEAAALPLRHHTGGRLDGGRYHNDHLDVDLRGPADWKPSQRTGGALFRVLWSGPDGGRLWLIGHRVPVGMAKWSEDAVDRWLTHQCQGRGLEMIATTTGSRWQPAPDNWCDAPGGGREQTVELRAVAADDPSASRHRRLRLLVHPDLLLVADGQAATSSERDALHKAMATLRRGR